MPCPSGGIWIFPLHSIVTTLSNNKKCKLESELPEILITSLYFKKKVCKDGGRPFWSECSASAEESLSDVLKRFSVKLLTTCTFARLLAGRGAGFHGEADSLCLCEALQSDRKWLTVQLKAGSCSTGGAAGSAQHFKLTPTFCLLWDNTSFKSLLLCLQIINTKLPINKWNKNMWIAQKQIYIHYNLFVINLC